MTTEQVSHLIKEALSSFSDPQEGPFISSVFEKLIPAIVDVSQSDLTGTADCSEQLFSLLDSYRKDLEASRQHLISIHLFSLIVFDRLEKEATKMHDHRLQKIWSDIGDRLTRIALTVNK